MSMGQHVQIADRRPGRHLGVIQAAAAPALVAAGPVGWVILGASVLAAFIPALLKKGYDPRKLSDTAVTEAVRIGFNRIWNALTGDNLPSECDPGKCGDQHIAIFTASRYPDVPYPAGQPGVDLDQVISQVQQMIADGRSKLVRQESLAGYDQNANYFMALLGEVAAARAVQGEEPFGGSIQDVISLIPGGDWKGILPWAAAGVVAYLALT